MISLAKVMRVSLRGYSVDCYFMSSIMTERRLRASSGLNCSVMRMNDFITYWVYYFYWFRLIV